MHKLGINTEVLKVHSTKLVGVSLGDTIKAANWISSSTFSRLCHRLVISTILAMVYILASGLPAPGEL